MKLLKRIVKWCLKKMPVTKDYIYGRELYMKYRRVYKDKTCLQFLKEHHADFLEVVPYVNKNMPVGKLLKKTDIRPVENQSFFYTIDCFKTIRPQKKLLSNYTVDYGMIVQHSFVETRTMLNGADKDFRQSELAAIANLETYLDRCKHDTKIANKYKVQLDAITSLFERPALTFFEGLQRILFYNQMLWQTKHTLNGLGMLDRILDEVYQHDIASNRLTRNEAKKLIADFFIVLHEYYWYKSAALVGDTGQIIILGGKMSDGQYFRNDLTDLFIEVSQELKLPDPKVLLRCASDMPEDLLEKAVTCIATGIGAPLLSNDDIVIPALTSDGCAEEDAYRYGTSACWEPIVPGISCDQNNMATLNFAIPLVHVFDDPAFEKAASVEEIKKQYHLKLKAYIEELLTPLARIRFEQDTLLSLASPAALKKGQNIADGGAKYNNIGLTSVGLGTVVNSLLNIQKLVFEEKRYKIAELNVMRRQNFANHPELLQEMKNIKPCFGCDVEQVVLLTREIIELSSKEFKKYHTYLGGHFKFGLSAPSYITEAIHISATFDGRKAGDPFSVHISANTPLATTELVSFAAQLDYNENRLNGNVIDFFVTPNTLKQNLKKYVAMLRSGFKSGIFQLQMNVVDSKTLIAAKASPELFPQLVVRVWGFSAYFNDLPDEYKDVLIARAIESEKAA